MCLRGFRCELRSGQCAHGETSSDRQAPSSRVWSIRLLGAASYLVAALLLGLGGVKLLMPEVAARGGARVGARRSSSPARAWRNCCPFDFIDSRALQRGGRRRVDREMDWRLVLSKAARRRSAPVHRAGGAVFRSSLTLAHRIAPDDCAALFCQPAGTRTEKYRAPGGWRGRTNKSD